MKVGDFVRHKTRGIYGTVHESTWGGSIHTWHEDRNTLEKTVGMTFAELEEDWEVINCPEGYTKRSGGGIYKTNSI